MTNKRICIKVTLKKLTLENWSPWTMVRCWCVMICLAISIEFRLVSNRRQTDAHRAVAYIVLAKRRAVKMLSLHVITIFLGVMHACNNG